MLPSSELSTFLKLRLAIARYGEMDRSGWWNTRGVMGRQGQTLIERGFPRTHALVQSRIVFEVAKVRCDQVFSAPETITLWDLPAELEDHFESHWSEWLEQGDRWQRFMERVDEVMDGGMIEGLTTLELIDERHRTRAADVQANEKAKSVRVGNAEEVDLDLLKVLATGFAAGQAGNLVVPYASLTI
jgi:hypothetical protein